MKELDAAYKKQLEAIAKTIQESEELTTYLDSEEDDDYKALQDAYEPSLAALHQDVVTNAPLQIIPLEEEMLAAEFEGLFIPRILGYSVLRGEINNDVKYTKPQLHFRNILRTIIKSANFDMIKQRIGQSVQIGFALSSDIWVTNLIADIDNKRIKTYFQNLVSIRFRDNDIRTGALKRYAKQFANMNFLTAKIPATTGELSNRAYNLVRFLKSRDEAELPHEPYEKDLLDFIQNDDFKESNDYVKVLVEIMRLRNASEKVKSAVTEAINKLRQEMPRFNEIYFDLLKEKLEEDHLVDMNMDRAMSTILDDKIDDDLIKFYQLMNTMHSKGYIHDDTVEEVRNFYNSYEGLSTINDTLRWTVSGYFHKLLSNLEENDYSEYFEMNKIFSVYVSLFSNEAFNQRVKHSILGYIKRLLKKYTDKRSKEYQEIKKFVSTSFVDMGFFSEKEVAELFKSRRKRKTA